MKTKPYLSLSLALALAIMLVMPASAFFVPSDGQSATLVLGQPDFTGSSAITSQSGMSQPSGVAVDPTTGKVFVADSRHHRVLRFADVGSLSNGAPAEAVLGEPDFTTVSADLDQHGMDTPFGVAVDASGRLWVADGEHTRVLRFDNASAKANGANADGVLGEPDFTTQIINTTRSGMAGPGHLAVDASGRLWVADGPNSRVLRFDNAAAKANGADADGVLGQPDFTTSAANTTQSGMAHPVGVAVDASGRLWVADYGNSRVLRFDNAAAKANGADADGVLGEPDFTSSSFQTTQNGMNGPFGVTVDTSGRLYVADKYNSRIMVFDAAASLANGANASSVLGQTNFTTGGCGTTDATLCGPEGAYYDPAAKVLWVADTGNNRVLKYGGPMLQILPFIGLVNRFLPPGTVNIGKIVIRTRDGAIHTFDVRRDTRILPAMRASQLGCGSFVTILAQGDPSTNQWVALRIVVHPAESGPALVSPICIPTDTPVPTEIPTATETPVGISPSHP